MRSVPIDHALRLDIADAFAAAALDRGRWIDALKLLADATGSARGQLIGIGGPRTIPFNWVTDFPTRALREFVEIEGGSAQVNPRVHASQHTAVLELVGEEHIEASIPHLDTDIYLDFMHQHDIPLGCHTKLVEGADGLIGLALLRTEADGATGQAQRALFAEAARHARSAVRIGAALGSEAAALLGDALAAVASAAFVLDAAGEVEASTPAADALLASGRLVIVGKQLSALDAGEAVILANAIGEVRRRGTLGGPIAVALAARPGTPLLVLDIATVPAGRWGFDLAPRLLVIVRAGVGDTAEAARLLRLLYGLTEAEAGIAVRAAAGSPREAIAAARGVSLETVRSQLKAVFAKLGVTREIEMATMLAPLLRGPGG